VEKLYFGEKFILMKSLKLTALFVCVHVCYASAQLKLGITSSLRSDFQKIMAEYPQHFEGIRGEVINQNPQTVEYVSQLKLADAEECFITKYSSGLKPIYSWQALMFTSEDFEAAYKKYKWVFSQLKGMNIYYVKDQYTLKGNFEEANESRKFTNSILTPAAPPDPLKKLKIDVALQFEFPEWKVKLIVYEKEREDDERGEIEE
jgi:hypothetical protein